jgi:hypothetical protein
MCQMAESSKEPPVEQWLSALGGHFPTGRRSGLSKAKTRWKVLRAVLVSRSGIAG